MAIGKSVHNSGPFDEYCKADAISKSVAPPIYGSLDRRLPKMV